MAHLTSDERYTISRMLKNGKRPSEISEILGRCKSVVSREIARNKDQRSGIYLEDLANRKYAQRQKEKPKKVKFTLAIQTYVEGLLAEDYSPEQIVGVSKKDGIPCVSHECIYQHIWANKKKKGTLYKHLRRRGRVYQKRGHSKDFRGRIKGRVSINQRPAIVEKRIRFGDIEVDLVLGTKGALVTANDRASGMLKMKKVKSKEAAVVSNAIIEIMEDWKPYLYTMTSDNGLEFTLHQKVSEFLALDYYFAHAFHSWERGSNENLNGLIRQYFHKKIDFNLCSDEYIQQIENKLNSRPRKRLNYENPIFVMNQLLFNQKVAFVT